MYVFFPRSGAITVRAPLLLFLSPLCLYRGSLVLTAWYREKGTLDRFNNSLKLLSKGIVLSLLRGFTEYLCVIERDGNHCGLASTTVQQHHS